MYDLTLLMGNMIKSRYGPLVKGLFHKSPELFGPFSGASIAFLSSQCCGSKPLKPCHPPGFSYIKNMLKDQLVKTSAFHFDNCVLEPEMFLGLSRPQICIMGEIFGVPNKSLATFFECQPFKSRSLSFVCIKWRVFLMQELILSQIALVILKDSLVFGNRQIFFFFSRRVDTAECNAEPPHLTRTTLINGQEQAEFYPDK